MTLPIDSSCEAEYEDGYIHSETELHDISPFDNTNNIFNDILEKRPEAEHGRMVRFSVFYRNHRHDVDWRGLPENARPIRFRDGYLTIDQSGNEESGWSGCRFGYQFNDPDGKNIKEVKEL
jgi:hypothetical protein